MLGVRPPVTGPVDDTPRSTEWVEHATHALDLSAHRYPDIEVLLRAAAVLVSDYTDALADFPVTGRPVVCFAPDLDDFAQQPGLLHDLDDLLPGPVCHDAAELRAALDSVFEEPSATARREYERRRAVLHPQADGRSARRLVREVKRTYLPIDDWLAEEA